MYTIATHRPPRIQPHPGRRRARGAWHPGRL